MRVPLTRAAAGAAALLGVAGCTSTPAVVREQHAGTGTASPAAAGLQQITLTTGADYRFHPSTIVVHPGRVRVVLVNTSPSGSGAPHDWSLTGSASAFVPLTPAGTRSSATFDTPAPGRYQFVCTIHRKQGQTGTLVVTQRRSG